MPTILSGKDFQAKGIISTITNPPHEAHGDFIIVDGGQEFFVVDNEDGWAANGVGKRL